MRLDAIIRQVLDGMDTRTGGPWIIVRVADAPHGQQIRFSYDSTLTREPVGVRLEARQWTTGEITGWSKWSSFRGFSAAAVLADDWELSKNVELGELRMPIALVPGARKLGGGVLHGKYATKILRDEWHGGAFGRHPDHLKWRDAKVLKAAADMRLGGDDATLIAIAQRELRIDGDSESGLYIVPESS